MFFRKSPRNEFQDRLDETRLLEDVQPDDAEKKPADSELRMTGLYEVIPGNSTSPIPVGTMRQS